MPPKNMKVKAPKKAANGYVLMTTPVPPGETVVDLVKNRWVIGPPIGRGGFGVIYSARKPEDGSENYSYVIKFEPHENGPLFLERSFYLRAAKEADIADWTKTHKLRYLGLPRYWGSGSHEIANVKYRFLVTDRFGSDLEEKFVENKKRFPLPVVLRVAEQTLDVLEYIHSTGYAHGDIKASNLVLGLTRATQNNVYLIDFGIASKISESKEYSPNPKKAHDGTIEYLSRDMHDGVPTMRGDLECLGFNMLHWLSGSLPWEKIAVSSTKHKEVEVQKLKQQFMSKPEEALKSMDIDKASAAVLLKFMKYCSSLEFNKKPQYETVHAMLRDALKATGSSAVGPLDFSMSKSVPTASTSKTTKKAPATSRAAKKKARAPSPESSDAEEDAKQVRKPVKAKVKQSAWSSEASDSEPEVNPKRKAAKPKAAKTTKSAAKAAPTSESSNEEEERNQTKQAAKPGKAGKTCAKCTCPVSSEEEDEDGEMVENTPSPPKRRKFGKAKEPKVAATAAAGDEPSKPLWSQSLTAQVSGVVRPGEYLSRQPAPAAASGAKGKGTKKTSAATTRK